LTSTKPKRTSGGCSDRAAKGEPFIIVKAGKPLFKVVPLETPDAAQLRRLGFMAAPGAR
jgi:prevent-host-death family protein